MAERTCSLPDCGRPHVARGWCGAHYERWRKYGDPTTRVRPEFVPGTCDADGCGQPREHRTWCRNHYQRWMRYGDPLGGFGRNDPPRSCTVTGCTQPTERIVRGMCEMHYNRFRLTGEAGDAEPQRILGDDEARFWSYVDKEGPLPPHRLTLGWCWQWTGALNANGYGSFVADGRKVGPHRWAYERFVGPIPDGWHVDHLCHNRACVNYERHLEAVPKAENNRRRLVVAPEYGWATL